MSVQPPLGGLSAAEFLRDYWQKQPLLIRQAFPAFRSPISPDELAGLACEEEVESRLVLEKHGEKPWEVRHGPFAEELFAELPDSHWSLLVQAVDRQVPAVADLLDRFRFLPNWRIDDIMISFAPPQGSVGPHTDSYDVFLLQIWGRRRWDISQQFPPDLLPEMDLRILREFSAEQSWVLEPGDMLYLPPQVAHHGVALEDCMTLSVGLLAPTQAELIGDYVDHVLLAQTDNPRYADPDLTVADAPGELTGAARAKIRAMVRSLPLDDAALDAWFGEFITRQRRSPPLEPLEPPLTEREWLADFRHEGQLRRDCRIVFLREASGVTLFAGGQCFPLSPELAFAGPLLSGQQVFYYADLADHLRRLDFLALLTRLTNLGFFYFHQE